MKTTFLGRNLFLLVALLATAFTFNSCRKDLLVQSPDNLKNALSIAEAKSYFNSHFLSLKKGNTSLSALQVHPSLQTLFANKQPIWDKAYQKMISTGGAVKIPLNFGESYAVVNKRTKAIVPAASLNYLLMYKDKKDSVHAEWVRLAPDSSWLYGNRDIYRGRIFVYDWDGKQLKSYRYGNTLDKAVKNVAVQNVSTTIEIEDCYRFSNGRCPKVGACAYECDMCLATCAYEICIVTTDPICESCTPTDPPTNPPGGTGGGQNDNGDPDGNGTGSGNPNAGDYTPNCNPDPNYVVPSYPAPEGMEWMMPCGDDVPVPETPNGSYDGLDLSQNTLAFAHKLVLNRHQASFMEGHQDIMNTINAYLGTGEVSIEANDFAKWAVGYLMLNTGFDYHIFFDANEFSGINNLPAVPPTEIAIDMTGVTDIPSNAPIGIPRLLASTPSRNNTEDLQYGTNGNTSGILSLQIGKNDNLLFSDMTDLFELTSTGDLQDVAYQFIDRFRNNIGGIYENQSLNNEVRKSATYSNFITRFKRDLQTKINNAGGVLDNTSMNLTYRPIFNGMRNKINGLQILINDTEQTQIKLLNFQINPTTQEWIADVEVTITDHFGLDKHDALTYQGEHKGFAAWWLLQNTRNYKPFITRVVVRNRLFGGL